MTNNKKTIKIDADRFGNSIEIEERFGEIRLWLKSAEAKESCGNHIQLDYEALVCLLKNFNKQRAPKKKQRQKKLNVDSFWYHSRPLNFNILACV